MARGLVNGWNRRRLRLALAVFFVALAVPTGVLITHAYGQLKWEAFHRHQALADELVARIDARLAGLVRAEEARSFADYAFLNVAGEPVANLVQRSPLSAWPVADTVPGVIGYFQVDADGRLSSPLLPPAGAGAVGLGSDERAARAERVASLQRVLARNRLVPPEPVAAGIEAETEADADAPVTGLGDSPSDLREQMPAASAPAPMAPSVAASASAPSAAPPRSDARERKRVERTESQRQAGREAAADDAPGGVADGAADAQAAFDRLKAAPVPRAETSGGIGRVEDLELARPYDSEPAGEAEVAASSAPEPARIARREQVALPAAQVAAEEHAAAPAAPITTFESELDPFEFSLLDSGHLVLFRKVWRSGQRFVQGLLLGRHEFLAEIIEQPFRATTLAPTTSLALAWRGDVLTAWSGTAERGYLAGAEAMQGALLRRARLSAPLSELELVFSVRHLPVGPGAGVLGWSAGVLALVLAAGFLLMYRAGCRQMDLARQQQDFVAAVSHELKTPLTSIRMYGEMLREGWVVDEQRRRGYYDYIVDESERLSRLIGNVLQLARMTRGGIEASLRPVMVDALAAQVREKVAAQVERAGFELGLLVDEAVAARRVLVDEDFVSQIAINLVDNALKFSRRAERLAVEVSFRPGRGDSVVLAVRDHGPGVPRRQMKRIFRLFYRAGSELTRETAGTGIGLALVHELARAMGASVDVVNRDPGAEFRVQLRTP